MTAEAEGGAVETCHLAPKPIFFQKRVIIFSKTLDFPKNYAIIDKDRIDEDEEWLASHSSFLVGDLSVMPSEVYVCGQLCTSEHTDT